MGGWGRWSRRAGISTTDRPDDAAPDRPGETRFGRPDQVRPERPLPPQPAPPRPARPALPRAAQLELRPDLLGYTGISWARRDDDECVLVIGFDFGTSSSKIVVQAPYLPESPVFIARRPAPMYAGPSWLWPTRLYVDADGVCSLHHTDGSRSERHLKIRLMDPSETENAETESREPGALAAAYLGLALRDVRRWALTTKANLLRSFATIQWSLNVGIPSGTTRDEAQERRFLRAVRAGWRLSLTGNPVREEDAALALREVEAAPDHPKIEIGLCPEVVAGAVGYARGDQRRDGLHLAMDVGASTVDACMFIVREAEDGELWPFLEAEVARLGTVELHERRLRALHLVDPHAAQWLRECYDPFDPTAAEPRLDDPRNPDRDPLAEVHGEVTKALHELVGGITQTTVTRRNPNAPEFKPGGSLPILLLGGGSRSRFYRGFVEEYDEGLRERLGSEGATVVDVPIPRALDRGTQNAGHRLAVAFGLSHPLADLPCHISPAEIADVPRAAPARPRAHFVDKDQV